MRRAPIRPHRSQLNCHSNSRRTECAARKRHCARRLAPRQVCLMRMAWQNCSTTSALGCISGSGYSNDGRANRKRVLPIARTLERAVGFATHAISMRLACSCIASSLDACPSTEKLPARHRATPLQLRTTATTAIQSTMCAGNGSADFASTGKRTGQSLCFGARSFGDDGARQNIVPRRCVCVRLSQKLTAAQSAQSQSPIAAKPTANNKTTNGENSSPGTPGTRLVAATGIANAGSGSRRDTGQRATKERVRSSHPKTCHVARFEVECHKNYGALSKRSKAPSPARNAGRFAGIIMDFSRHVPVSRRFYGAYVFWINGAPPTIKVPKYVGLNQTDAKSVLENGGLQMRVGKETYNTKKPEGTVLDGDLPAGKLVGKRHAWFR